MIGGKPAIPPTLTDLFDMHGDDVGAQLRVCLPGSIWTYDSAKRTAEVAPGYSRVYNDGTAKQFSALLVDVPVFTLQGGGIHVGLPVQKGDECLVVFSDFNIDAWYQNGGQPPPLDFRRHDLSDGFALVGFNSQANPLASSLLATEGGLAFGLLTKVAISRITGMITVANGPAPANNLNGILQAFLAAVIADPGIPAPTKAAATAAAAALATLLY